jgi:HIV Tat-specific factor 1
MDAPFPTDPRQFDSDDRISFSKVDNKFIAVHDDGSEFEFNADLKRWVPAEEEESLDGELEGLVGHASSSHDIGESASKKRKNGSNEGAEVSRLPRAPGYTLTQNGRMQKLASTLSSPFHASATLNNSLTV